VRAPGRADCAGVVTRDRGRLDGHQTESLVDDGVAELVERAGVLGQAAAGAHAQVGVVGVQFAQAVAGEPAERVAVAVVVGH